ncbi:unnamed protein product, partial [Allacma fusca]
GGWICPTHAHTDTHPGPGAQSKYIEVLPRGPSEQEPEFAEPIENITVPAGREVKLACSVKNLGPHKNTIKGSRAPCQGVPLYWVNNTKPI